MNIMRRSRLHAGLCAGLVALGASIVWSAGGCSAVNDTPGRTWDDEDTDSQTSGGGKGSGDASSGSNGSGSGNGSGGSGGGLQVGCPGGGSTTLSGTVLAPTPPQYGPADPIYNALVYIPSTPVEPFAPGATCQNCGAAVSGGPIIASAITSTTGTFVLNDVPAGNNVPLVIQIGRWRRQITVPEIKKCENNALPAELTRLPRNSKEGDIPKIALASSKFDAEECILRKIGIEDSEFTVSGGNGRVHIYQGDGATIPGTQPMEALWSDLGTLMQYDMVLFPCLSVPSTGNTAAYQNVFEYANAGGRVFATDLSNPWIQDAPAPFPGTAQWSSDGTYFDPLPALVDVSFPKGAALAEWLQSTGATSILGEIPIHETYIRAEGVNPPTTRWLYSTSPTTVQTFSFNTPIGVAPDQQCGRAVYSTFHIANGFVTSGANFPTECNSSPLTPQEKVLEFLLFDLASCVQDDTEPPEPPH